MAIPNSGEADVATIARALWRNRRSIIGPTLIITAAAFIAVNLMKPKYTSEVRILVEARENVFLRPQADKAQIDRSSLDQAMLTSQVQLVLSRDLAQEMVERLNLSELPEFNSLPKGFSLMTVPRALGLVADPQSMPLEERLLASYYARLSAKLVEKSRVIIIEFQSADPEFAARAADAIAAGYLVLQQRARQDQAFSAGQWLSAEIEKLRNKVAEAEANVENFRAKSGIFVGAKDVTLSSQQLSELNAQLSSARAQKTDAETRARLLRAQLSLGQPLELSDVTGSELIRRLSEQRLMLRTQFAEQSSTLLPQHPRIKQMQAQIGDLDNQIKGEGERLVRSLENDAKVADARLDALNANLNGVKRETASTSDQDVQLRALEREAKAHRDTFEVYLAKYGEAIARGSVAAAPADARIISHAMVTNLPSSPNKIAILLIAAVTLCLSSALVVAGVLIKGAPVQLQPRAAESKRSLESSPNADLPFDDILPMTLTSTGMNGPGVAVPTSTIEDIVTALCRAGEDGRRVAIIGTGRAVGTTLAAIAVGRSLARNARTVLVDLAVNAPNIDVISNDPSAPGIADLVRGAASFGDIITRDRFSSLHVVALGRIEGDPTQSLHSHLLLSAVDALGRSYDYLVLDAGALSENELAPIVQMAGLAVLVAGSARDSSTGHTRDRLLASGFAEVTVLTGALPRPQQTISRSAAA